MDRDEIETMQQVVTDAAPESASKPLTVSLRPGHGRLAMMAALASVATMGGGVDHGSPRGSRSVVRSFNRAAMERHFDGSEKAQKEKIEKAKAKRERKRQRRAR